VEEGKLRERSPLRVELPVPKALWLRSADRKEEQDRNAEIGPVSELCCRDKVSKEVRWAQLSGMPPVIPVERRAPVSTWFQLKLIDLSWVVLTK
jgi:hypothetical protein